MIRKFFLCLIFALVYTVSGALIVHADNPGTGAYYPPNESPYGFVSLATYNGKLAGIYNSGTGDLSNFINSLFKFALAIGALAAVLRLVYAGYLYMGQADMWSHKGEAKKIIGDVTLGLLLLLGIWLILYQINPDIVKLDALKNIKPLPQTQSTSGSINTSGVSADEAQRTDTLFTPQPTEPIPAGEMAAYTSQQQIPVGSWCSQTASNYWECAPDSSTCNSGATSYASCRQY